MRRPFASTGLRIVSLFVSFLALVGLATAADVTYSFNLIGPQITASGSGDKIAMTGAGSFDTTAGTVVASGSFAQFNANGSVVKGTWLATSFASFDAFGGPNSGLQGGVLQIMVTLTFQHGGQQTGVPMSVTCLINAPPGFTGNEGITLGDFTTPVRGRTLFHVNN